jgi:hypothetical protein
MGCHTWFYKKIQDPSSEEVHNIVKDRCEKELSFLDRLINDRSSVDADLLEAYPEWTPEWATSMKDAWSKIYNFVDGGELNIKELPEAFNAFFDEGMSRDSILAFLYEMWTTELTTFIEGKGWFEDTDEFHDVFRKYGYPDDKLFSLEETLEYIKDPNNQCTTYEWTDRRLKEFWEKYPNGMIKFG